MLDPVDYYIAGIAIVGTISMIALLIIEGTDCLFEEEEDNDNDNAETAECVDEGK